MFGVLNVSGFLLYKGKMLSSFSVLVLFSVWLFSLVSFSFVAFRRFSPLCFGTRSPFSFFGRCVAQVHQVLSRYPLGNSSVTFFWKG